ncbi:hypothetical protein ANN_13603 [Periplaneta americana]|uniref:Phosphatidylinositol-3-phosphatase n=1 Tax=Periplaneta americana TaxID=6978 RepID=A0ABQ8TLL6_PERAM|nr:hypothetical protein ANN_13603 [Periplaneta americana]
MLDRYNARKPSIGTLYLTATHLIFVDPDGKRKPGFNWLKENLDRNSNQILHMHIASVEKLPLTTTGSPLQIRCKTFLSVTFVIPRERDCHEVFMTLQQLAQPVHIEDLYCFHYTSSTEDIPKPAGWNFFDLQSEYQRMRVPSDQWSLTLLNKDYESVIRFLNARHLKPAEIYRQLKEVYGDTVMNERNVRQWCEMFNNGRTNVHDETRPGRPSLITEDLKTKVNDRILQDRCTSLDELHIAFPDISRSLLGEIVSQHLGYHKICAQWVSHNTPETKRQSRQWHHPSSPKKPRIFKQTLSTQKVMATVFWDHKGVLLLDFMPKGTTINANRYCETLRKLWRAIQNKRRGMLSRGVVLLHDNARPHTATSTRELLDQFGWEIFDHPPYSPDLAPSDFHLFTKLKDFLGCTRFGSDEELKKTVNTWLNELAAEEYNTGILKLAAICRCSQPLSGFSARCLEDEQMLNCVLRTNPNNSYMYVVDTRPRINAMANRAAGKGYESENFYENIKFHFLGIENIHVMRSSLAKLIETCELKSPSMSSFLGGVESSGWLRHIKSILETSWFIAQAVDEKGISVVVHCSDGWDRTAQVCSLASLFLDPYYRTIQGFQALIEKDWLAFGHKFSDRCGHVAGDPKEVSPVFTQFIDCTWQLAQQFPSTFQFNERFLLTLHDHVQSCQFGTFIGNCEKDRVDLRLNERTFSLWGYMANHMNEYINPLYSAESTPDVLVPNIAPQNIKFWRGMYCRFESGVHPREPLGDLLLATCDHSSSLEDHIRLLTKRINFLKQHLAECGDNKRNLPPLPIEGTIDGLKGMLMDNKYLYEKCREEGLSPSSLAQLKISHSSNNGMSGGDSTKVSSNPADVLSVEQLAAELNSVALDWKTLRNIRECVCSTPFDHFSRKVIKLAPTQDVICRLKYRRFDS